MLAKMKLFLPQLQLIRRYNRKRMNLVITTMAMAGAMTMTRDKAPTLKILISTEA